MCKRFGDNLKVAPLLLALHVLAGCSARSPSGVPLALRPLEKMQGNELVNERRPQASTVAKAVQACLDSIVEGPEATTILMSLTPLQKDTGAVFDDGCISLHFGGRTYRVYMLLAGQCVRIIKEPGGKLRITVSGQRPMVSSDTLAEGGRYRVYMVEDNLITWAWDLVPAFKDAGLPETGGFDPGEAFLLAETTRRLRDCSDH